MTACSAPGNLDFAFDTRLDDVVEDGLMSIDTQRKALRHDSRIPFGGLVYAGQCRGGTAALFSTITYVQTGGVRHIYFAAALVFAAWSSMSSMGALPDGDGRVLPWAVNWIPSPM